MTEALYRDDAYRIDCAATVASVDERGIALDRTVFYPRGGGQAGDAGRLVASGGNAIAIADTVKGEGAAILHVPAPGQEVALAQLSPGMKVTAAIDWDRRYRHMRFHT